MTSKSSPAKPVPAIVIVDDHEVVRSGMKALLELHGDFTVVGEAGDVAECVTVVEESRPDLVVLDLHLPDGSGLAACGEVSRRFPTVEVLMFASSFDETAVVAARRVGASGFVSKEASARDLVAAVRRVLEGDDGVWPTPARMPAEIVSPVLTLSPRELAVAWYLARGLSNREIATRTGLAEKTVKNYVSHVLTKLRVTRRSSVAAIVARVEANGVPLHLLSRSSTGRGGRAFQSPVARSTL